MGLIVLDFVIGSMWDIKGENFWFLIMLCDLLILEMVIELFREVRKRKKRN